MWAITTNDGVVISSLYENWKNIKDVCVERLFLNINRPKKIMMCGFEKYIYFEERYAFLNKSKNDVLDTINVLGKYGDCAVQISYNVPKGYVFQTKNEWGKEFTPLIWNPLLKTWDKGCGRKTNDALWVDGNINPSPIVKLV